MALENTPQTDPSREIQEEDRITRRQAHVERAAIVAIHDPARLHNQVRNDACPFIAWRGSPARSPVARVEMNERKVEALR